MWREKKKLLTCLLLSYVFFHIYIFTPRYFERGKEREKTSIFQFVANLFALAFMLSNSFYVECVLHKIGVFRLLFCLRNEYQNGIEAEAKAIKRGRNAKKGSNKYFVRLSSLLLSIKIRFFRETAFHLKFYPPLKSKSARIFRVLLISQSKITIKFTKFEFEKCFIYELFDDACCDSVRTE